MIIFMYSSDLIYLVRKNQFKFNQFNIYKKWKEIKKGLFLLLVHQE